MSVRQQQIEAKLRAAERDALVEFLRQHPGTTLTAVVELANGPFAHLLDDVSIGECSAGVRASAQAHTLAGRANLRPQESVVLQHLLAGLSDADISKQLGVSYSRVRQVITNVFHKLGVRRRTDLLKLTARGVVKRQRGD